VEYQGQQCQLLIRDYYCLRDERLEPETAKLKLDSVRAYSLYDRSVRFSFSVLNDYTSDSPLNNSVVAHAAELSSGGVDRLADGVAEIRQITKELGAVVATVSAQIRSAESLTETLEIIRRTYYRASPIASAVGEDWEPTSEFIAEFVNKLSDFEGAMPPDMTREDFGAMVDPRV
jgi:hypothetical protein